MKLDPLFTQHIHTDTYHVFLTPHDEEHGLAVKVRAGRDSRWRRAHRRTLRQREEGDGLGRDVSWRVVAKRNDIKGERLPVWEVPTPAFAKPEPPVPAAAPQPAPAPRP